MTETPIEALAGVHVSAAARHGALVRYADSCRAQALDAAAPACRDELLAEARAAEAAACAVREGRGVV